MPQRTRGVLLNETEFLLWGLIIPRYTGVSSQVPGTFFQAIQDLKRLFVKATLVSKCLTSAWHLTENRFALLALLYYNSHAKNLVAFLKPEATARAGVSPQRPGCNDYARRLSSSGGCFSWWKHQRYPWHKVAHDDPHLRPR